MAEPVAEVFSFPTDIAEFDQDERISFSRLESRYIAVTDDGTEYEFDAALRRWIPQIDEDLIAAQQSAYGRTHAEENDDDTNNGRQPRGRKRKQDAEVLQRRAALASSSSPRPPPPPPLPAVGAG